LTLRIAFFGDSLTEGKTGVPVLPLLEASRPGDRFINCGRGGDTVKSLLRRIRSQDIRRTFDLAFLWVGVNDILALQSLSYSLFMRARGRGWARSEEDFTHHYGRCLRHLLRSSPAVVAVPPLLIGEDLSSPWNNRLARLSALIQELSERTAGVRFLDIRKDLPSLLPERGGMEYRPKGLLGRLRRRGGTRLSPGLEGKEQDFPFRLTIDGVHLSHRGAEMAAGFLLEAIAAQGKDAPA
jgi:lysophospholipase L1-like esterase